MSISPISIASAMSALFQGLFAYLVNKNNDSKNAKQSIQRIIVILQWTYTKKHGGELQTADALEWFENLLEKNF